MSTAQGSMLTSILERWSNIWRRLPLPLVRVEDSLFCNSVLLPERYVHAYICVHTVHTYVHGYVYIHTYVRGYVYIHMYIRGYVYTQFVHACISVCSQLDQCSLYTTRGLSGVIFCVWGGGVGGGHYPVLYPRSFFGGAIPSLVHSCFVPVLLALRFSFTI